MNCQIVFYSLYEQKYCSSTCYGVIHRGEKHHVYKGENAYSKIRHRIMFMPEYRGWRLSVFERDLYTCQDCGESGVKLEAHHIKPMALILKEFNIISPIEARKCFELWDRKNGQTLCVDCHKKTDSYLSKFKLNYKI